MAEVSPLCRRMSKTAFGTMYGSAQSRLFVAR